MLFLICLSILTALILWIQRHYSKWERENIPCVKANIPFGSMNEVRLKKKSFGLISYELYNSTKEKILGFYIFHRPALLIRDPDLVKLMLTSDFASFCDRGVYVDEKRDPLSGDLFSLRVQSWRTLRAKLTPSFSSGKLKGMFGTVDDVGNKMIEHLNKLIDKTEEKVINVDIKDIMTT